MHSIQYARSSDHGQSSGQPDRKITSLTVLVETFTAVLANNLANQRLHKSCQRPDFKCHRSTRHYPSELLPVRRSLTACALIYVMVNVCPRCTILYQEVVKACLSLQRKVARALGCPKSHRAQLTGALLQWPIWLSEAILHITYGHVFPRCSSRVTRTCQCRPTSAFPICE